MFGRILGNIRAARTRRRQPGSPPAHRHPVRPQLEVLERRDAPTVLPPGTPGGVLTVNCTGGPDTVTGALQGLRDGT